MRARSRISAGERVFRALLLLLPGDFRSDFGAAMAADADSMRATARWWTREIPGLIGAAAREHVFSVAGDIAMSVRRLTHTPGFTVAAILMLAIGTGANVAVYSVVDAVLVRPSIPDPARAVFVRKLRANLPSMRQLPLTVVRDIQRLPQFEAVSALSGRIMISAHNDTPRRIAAECVSPSIVAITGVRPAIGRMFTDEEDRAGAEVVVISDAMWQRDFGGASDVIGRDVGLDGPRRTIIGVMPRGFTGAMSLDDTEVWAPIGQALAGDASSLCGDVHGAWVVARLARPNTPTRAASSLAAAGFDLEPLQPLTSEGYRQPIIALMITALAVLLIACANVANLQLERGSRRGRETSVRLALGASRWSLGRQAVVENLMLSLAGGGLGAALASPLVATLAGLMPRTIPHRGDVVVDARVLLVTIGTALACGLVVGLVAAFKTLRAVDLRSTRSVTSPRSALSEALVTLAVALSVMLIVGAGLMARTLDALNTRELGFETSGRVVAELDLLSQPLANRAFTAYPSILAQLRARPATKDAAIATYLPLRGYPTSVNVVIDGSTTTAWSGAIGGRFARAMGTPLIAGREFDDDDTAGSAPVAVVNKTFVDRAFEGQAARVVGRLVDVRDEDGNTVTRRIVGVLSDMRTGGYDTKTRVELFTPVSQSTPSNFVYFVVKTDQSADQVRHDLTEIIRPSIAQPLLEPVELLAVTVDKAFARPRFAVWLFGLLAGIAALLAGSGLAAIIAWSVADRRREIAIRLALGSSATSTITLMLRRALIMTVIGVTIGVAGAALGTRLLSDWLYRVNPRDLATFVSSTFAMLAVAALAAYLPARRAARIDPATTLRAE